MHIHSFFSFIRESYKHLPHDRKSMMMFVLQAIEKFEENHDVSEMAVLDNLSPTMDIDKVHPQLKKIYTEAASAIMEPFKYLGIEMTPYYQKLQDQYDKIMDEPTFIKNHIGDVETPFYKAWHNLLDAIEKRGY